MKLVLIKKRKIEVDYIKYKTKVCRFQIFVNRKQLSKKFYKEYHDNEKFHFLGSFRKKYYKRNTIMKIKHIFSKIHIARIFLELKNVFVYKLFLSTGYFLV